MRALDDVSFEVPEGQTVAIIGRSGGGKSSLLRALGGLLKPVQGVVSVAGHRLDHGRGPSRAFCRDVGVVFQDYGLVPQLDAMHNVLCGRLFDYNPQAGLVQFRREDCDRARALLVDLGLQGRLTTRCSRLSGGEQQRVGIARLLLQDPNILLLDEPISSLDVHWAEHTIQRLKQARAGRATVLVVLHDLAMVRRYADRVLLVHGGKIVFDGDPGEGCRQLEMLGIEPHQAAHTDFDHARAATTPTAPAAKLAAAREREPGAGLLGRASYYVLLIGAVIAAYVWAALGVNFSATKVFGNLGNAVDFLRRMLPPDFSVTTTVAQSLLETIQMALIGTTLAALGSLPIAMCAARNIAPWPFQFAARLVLNLLRTIPSIIWGLFFVVIVGLGPFPGILALTFYASGYLGKFYYEGIEAIDPKPLLALKTVGASPIQRFRYGVFPQVLPLLLGYTLYMFEYNVRAASILGVVGAGGVGFYIYTYINNFQYDKAATALLLLLVLVTIIDAASSRLRARLMD
ncbi:MAG: phosphonate ABC transporter, permease protein PhnE [Bradymonadaceae bacterium]|nr:phosphonate ABC transporter, permease protein PhnE [Lujinxingiaceae bacterium]